MRDRFPLFLAGLISLVAILLFWGLQLMRQGEFADKLSTYRASEGGSQALFLFAQESGLAVDRRKDDFQILKTDDALVVVGIGDFELDQDASEKLLEFVEKGGRLLIGVPHASNLMNDLGITLIDTLHADAIRSLHPSVPSRFTAGVLEVEAPVASYLNLPDYGVPLLTDEDNKVAAAWLPFGDGSVVVLAAPLLAANEYLARADNAQFWYSMLQTLQGEAKVMFDEYHHGFKKERRMSEFAYKYGIHFTVAQALLGLVFWILALRRQGKTLVPITQMRSNRLDTLRTTGRLYRLGKHWKHCAELLVQGVAHEFALHVGTSPHGSTLDVAHALENRKHLEMSQKLRNLHRRASTVRTESELHELAQLAASAHASIHQNRPSKGISQ